MFPVAEIEEKCPKLARPSKLTPRGPARILLLCCERDFNPPAFLTALRIVDPIRQVLGASQPGLAEAQPCRWSSHGR